MPTRAELPNDEPAGPEVTAPRRLTAGQTRLIVVIVALAAASTAFHLLATTGFRHSAAVFIGIPTLLALLVARSGRPATGTGVVMRVITLALLLSSIVFAEGMVCILLAAPIFYLVGFLVSETVFAIRDGLRKRKHRTFFLLTLIILPTGIEGTMPGVEWNREESVTVSRIVPGAPAEVRAALAARPGFAPALPPFLRLGFPIPIATAGSGLALGDERTIVFAHAHGGHVERGTLAFRIAERDSQFIRFEPVSDDSYVIHWLTWRSSEVRWRAVSPTATRVDWTLRYRRRLDPAWYFKPLERYGVGVAAGYLIDALATPGAPPSSAPIAISPAGAEAQSAEHRHGP
jgi:hypothetical protein